MKYSLIKLSGEGWEKTFHTPKGVLEELEKWICKDCFLTDSLVVNLNLAEEAYLPDDWNKHSTEEAIGHLLGTPCGCEFTVDDKLMDEIYDFWEYQ